MKVGVRIPSLNRRIAARTSWRRVVRHRMGLKMPAGYGWITSPHRALYNHVYSRTTVSVDRLLGGGRRRSSSPFGALLGVLAVVVSLLAAIMSFGTSKRRRRR